MRIAVAGGTGHVGSHVTYVARERGHDVVVPRGVEERTSSRAREWQARWSVSTS